MGSCNPYASCCRMHGAQHAKCMRHACMRVRLCSHMPVLQHASHSQHASNVSGCPCLHARAVKPTERYGFHSLQERIEQAGGLLLNNGGLRLMGMLATTRAIGDHDLQPYGLTPVPEVMRIPRSPDDEFLVSALAAV